jgi:hypothetical protein
VHFFSCLTNFVTLMIFADLYEQVFCDSFSHKFVSQGLVFFTYFYFKFPQNIENSNSNRSIFAEQTKLNRTDFINIRKNQPAFNAFAIHGGKKAVYFLRDVKEGHKGICV